MTPRIPIWPDSPPPRPPVDWISLGIALLTLVAFCFIYWATQ